MTEAESVRIVSLLRARLTELDEWGRANLLRDLGHAFCDHTRFRLTDGAQESDDVERRAMCDVMAAIESWWDQAARRRPASPH